MRQFRRGPLPVRAFVEGTRYLQLLDLQDCDRSFEFLELRHRDSGQRGRGSAQGFTPRQSVLQIHQPIRGCQDRPPGRSPRVWRSPVTARRASDRDCDRTERAPFLHPRRGHHARRGGPARIREFRGKEKSISATLEARYHQLLEQGSPAGGAADAFLFFKEGPPTAC